jgi:4-amino-4-deoxy-L-arabinose transferase-like glycosyltransferase
MRDEGARWRWPGASVAVLLHWIRQRERALALALTGAAVALRGLLVAYSPTPFGYVWDPYHLGVAALYTTGRLPIAEDCWACFHPPLYYLLGWPFYAIGRWLQPQDDDMALRFLGGLALVSAAVTVYYGYRLLRVFRCRGATLVLGLALLIVCPCLFISSYAPEADIVLTAILSAFLYYFVRYFAQPTRATRLGVLRIGVLAGAAAATKYSGLVAPVTIVLVMALQFGRLPARRVARHAGLMLLAAVLVGGWKYVDNARRYGRVLHANGSASAGFAVAGGGRTGAPYDFTTIRVGELRRLITGRTAGALTHFPVYYSVWTTLHALTWSDMSFFSVPSRHGDPSQPYPRKQTPVRLTMLVIVLAFVPEILALAGFIRTLRHPVTWPLAIFAIVGAGAYVWWFLPQELWALKTKYILFLLPPGVLYAMCGLGWLHRRLPPAAAIAGGVLVLLVAAAHLYLYAFAVGGL